MKGKVKEIVLSVGAVAVGIYALYGIGKVLFPSPVYRGSRTNFYGVASKAISDSDMWSSNKLASIKKETEKFN